MMNCKECFLWNAMGSEDRKRIDANGGFGRYRALKLRQAVLNKQHIIQIAPMYENTQTVIDYVMDDEKSHAITLKFEGCLYPTRCTASGRSNQCTRSRDCLTG